MVFSKYRYLSSRLRHVSSQVGHQPITIKANSRFIKIFVQNQYIRERFFHVFITIVYIMTYPFFCFFFHPPGFNKTNNSNNKKKKITSIKDKSNKKKKILIILYIDTLIQYTYTTYTNTFIFYT